MNFFPHRRLLSFGSLACLCLVFFSLSVEAGSNDKRAFKKFKGVYQGAWNAAGALPVALRLPKGKGKAAGIFDAVPCNPADSASPLLLRIKKTKVRRNGKKLLSNGVAIWEREKAASQVGSNLFGPLRLTAIRRGKKAIANGSLATGRLSGSLKIRKKGKLPVPVCVEKAFAFTSTPVPIPDEGSPGNPVTLSIFVPNATAVVADLDVSIDIVSVFNADFDVTLRHVPSGTEIELFTDIGHQDDGIFVRLDDSAATDIGDVPDDPGDAPLTGVFKPEGPAKLAAFNGVLASGEWQLIVEDDSIGLTGDLASWVLHIK